MVVSIPVEFPLKHSGFTLWSKEVETNFRQYGQMKSRDAKSQRRKSEEKEDQRRESQQKEDAGSWKEKIANRAMFNSKLLYRHY